MAEESQVIRGINWRETFPFTHIFRSFRIAIHPSKLVLAMLALLSLYFGGRILDGVWPSNSKAVPGEIFAYEQGGQARLLAFRTAKTDKAVSDYADLLPNLIVKPGAEYAKLSEQKVAKEDAQAHKYIADMKYWLGTDCSNAVKAAEDNYKKVEKKDKAAHDARETAIKDAYARYTYRMGVIENLNGRGLFSEFFNYQVTQVNGVADAVRNNQWFGGDNSVIRHIVCFFVVGPIWAIANHWAYFLLFGLLFLVVWAIFGGAISRIAAVHIADEGRKLSIRQGIAFSTSKFLSFISAPLIPLLIVAVIGMFVAVVAGAFFMLRLEIVVAALFFLALAAGFIMTLVLLGTAGGFNMMYPAIAVEGSDSFDAISRSFSYVYSKPWRVVFYTLVAVGYGAITYLFVKFFIGMVLALTHIFVGLLVFREAYDGTALWTAMMPLGSSLQYQVNHHILSSYSGFSATILAIWNYLLVSLAGAFAISFYFSANTIVYYLVRRDADATEMDDVYLDQPEEEFAETAPAATPAATPPAAATARDSLSVVTGRAATPAATPPAAATPAPTAVPAPAAPPTPEPPAAEPTAAATPITIDTPPFTPPAEGPTA